MTDWLLKWIDAWKKETNRNARPKEKQSWSKMTLKWNHHPQLQNHNMPTNDVDNTNGTNYGDLLFANKSLTVPRWIERIP